MKVRKINYLVLSVLVLAILARCQKEETLDIDWQNNYTKKGNLLISNNPYQLSSQRISLVNELVPIVNNETSELTLKSTTDFSKIELTNNYAFKLMAEVASPVYDDNTLQATHVAIKDNYAFVTYNTRGSEWQGGVEVFNVSDLENPSLVSSVILPNADVSSVDYYNGAIYIVGATGDYEALGYNSAAFLEVLDLDENMEISSIDTMIDISSYAGTDIIVTEAGIMCTSGSDGSLTVFDFDYNIVQEIDIADARSLDVNSSYIYVLQGEDGNIQKYDLTTFNLVSNIALESSNTPGPKSEIAVNEDYIFAAMNEGGLSMLNSDGTLKQHIAKPETPEGSLDENHVTNSVSLNNDLVLIGNGESGVNVGGIVEEISDSIYILGSMQFDGYASTNFVESKDSVIFVATGLEGFKIISITIDEGVPDTITPTEPCTSLLGDISELFPELTNAKELHPELFSDTSTVNIYIEEETELYVTFIDEGASLRNTFGYYTYQADNPPTSIDEIERNIIFPNVSKIDEGGALQYGDKVKIGDAPFPAGTVVGFYLTAAGWQNGTTVEGYYTHYTNAEFNTAEKQQSTLFISNRCNDLVLTFEDTKETLSYCDHDFNDLIITIHDNNEGVPNTKINNDGIIEYFIE